MDHPTSPAFKVSGEAEMGYAGEGEYRGQVFILHSPSNSVKNEDLTLLFSLSLRFCLKKKKLLLWNRLLKDSQFCIVISFNPIY